MTPEGESAAVIATLDATRICTVYGGDVAPRELAVGQRVGVWADGVRAVAVTLASTDPNDDWPK